MLWRSRLRCCSLPAPTPAQAKTRRKRHHPSPHRRLAGAPDPSAAHTGPITDLEEQLAKNHRSKTAAQLKLAWDALVKPNLAQARKLAAPLKGDVEFGDYARWILARADLEQARHAYEADHPQEAAKIVKGLSSSLLTIETSYPYSPLVRRVPYELAQAELILARVACDAESWPGCRKQYESAFQRIIGTPEWISVLPADLEAYSQACLKQKNELCTAFLDPTARLLLSEGDAGVQGDL